MCQKTRVVKFVNVNEMSCNLCNYNFLEFAAEFYKNDPAALIFFQNHGVIPELIKCPTCSAVAVYCPSNNTFRCNRVTRDSKSRKTRCSFIVSRNKGTWFEKCRLSYHRNLLFCALFFERTITQRTIEGWLDISSETILDWKSHCLEICGHWSRNQEPLGGVGKIVEIGESKFLDSKCNRSRNREGQWVFGAIQRDNKRLLLFAVDKPDSETFVPLIKENILPGTTIYSDLRKAYDKLGDEGYQHHVVNSSKEGVHTQTIKRVWKDIQSWIKRSGDIKKNRNYLSKYLFCRYYNEKERIHYFLKTVAQVYKHPNSYQGYV